MYLPDEIVEEVRQRNDIVDVVSSYVRLNKRGSNYFGLCPFHNEKTGSFSVTPSKQMFYCFGCHQGGNVITFVQKYENMTFTEAVKMLADRAGITLPESDDRDARERENLTIIGQATVDRVLFDGDAATGILAIVAGEAHQFAATLVILSAGSIHSPAILEQAKK